MGAAALCLCGTLTSSCSRRVTHVLAAAAITLGSTLSHSKNTAIAQRNPHSAEVKRTRRRELRINVLKDAVRARKKYSSSAYRVTSGGERPKHENRDAISTQQAFISDDMDIISIDELTVSAAEPSISDDMDIISIDELTVSAAEPSISDDMDIISAAEPSISDDIDIISAAELSISDDIGIISIDGLTISAAELSVSDDMDMISIDELTVSADRDKIMDADTAGRRQAWANDFVIDWLTACEE